MNETYEKRVKITYMLIAFYIGLSSIAEFAVLYFFKDNLELTPAQASRSIGISFLPWAIKPVFGIISDFYPIFGYRRKPYILLCALISFLSWTLLSYVNSIIPAVIFLFSNNLALAFSSVVAQAVLVGTSHSKTHSQTKHGIGLFFLLKQIGNFLGAFLKGYLLEIMTIKSVFKLTACLSIFNIAAFLVLDEVPIIKNNKENIEEKGFSQPLIDNNKDCSKSILLEEKQNDDIPAALTLTKNLSADSLSIASYSQVEDSLDNMWWVLKKKECHYPLMLILFIFSVPNYSDPLFYFLTNRLGFNPMDLGILSVISSVGLLVAICFYLLVFKEWSVKSVLYCSSLFYFLFSFLCLVLVLRINHSWGLSDIELLSITYLFTSIFMELSMMPLLSIAAIICPEKLEGTIYSIFMSAFNLGMFFSFMFGSVLTQFYGITSTNFDNFYMLIITSNVIGLFPILAITMIDDKYLKDCKKIKLYQLTLISQPANK